MRKKCLLPLLAVLLIAADRIAKIIFSGKEFFIFNYIENTGTFFGFFKGYNFLLLVLGIIILLLMIFYFIHVDFNKKIVLVFIISGILSNLIDRVFFGHVIDFIYFKFWPIFNLADVFIVTGVIALIILILKK